MTKRKNCLKIQWTKLTVNKKGKAVCPICGAKAELVIGMFGPCYAHKTKKRV